MQKTAMTSVAILLTALVGCLTVIRIAQAQSSDINDEQPKSTKDNDATAPGESDVLLSYMMQSALKKVEDATSAESTVKAQLARAQKRLADYENSSPPDERAITDALDAFKKAVTDLNRSLADKSFKYKKEGWAYETAYKTLISKLGANRIARSFFDEDDETSLTTSITESVWLEKALNVYKLVSDDAETEEIPGLKQAINELTEQTKSVSVSDLKQVIAQRRALTVATLKKTIASIDSELKTAQSEHETALKNVSSIDAKLKAAKAAGRLGLDYFLLWLTFGMLFCLPLTFAILRWFPESSRQLLVENRTIIELVGVVYLLLTVILLLTGEKLSREAAATILGTIAGYVFARRGASPAPTTTP